jgi:nucleoside-diphosphate-sugar epimerase
LDVVQTLNDILLEKGALRKPVAPVFRPNREGDVSKSCASIERITNAIDWVPTIEFQDGLREMIEFTLSKRQVE